MKDNKSTIVIGGGPAGMAASIGLADMGIQVLLTEAGEQLGGKLTQWHHLFPDRLPAHELLDDIQKRLSRSSVEVLTGCLVREIHPEKEKWRVRSSRGEFVTDAVLVATGFDVFDARLKEEYGYGIYDNVITSVDLEALFREGRLVNKAGMVPERVGFVHCVGSRDEKVGNHHCSKACCITGVKQAIEVRETLPGCEVYNFYMDMRMFGSGYEELYREAQEKHNVTFIRGRVSEASEGRDGRVIVKAEDTLSGRPLKITVDLLVLLVGMVPSSLSSSLMATGGIAASPDGFMHPVQRFSGMNLAAQPGLFMAGACAGPRSIPEAISDGRSAAIELFNYIKNREVVRIS